MAPTTREIPREEWREYFDDFSSGLATTLASIEVTGPDDIVVIALDSEGDEPGELERTVSEPQKIYVEEENATTVLDIEDSEGNKTLVRMEPAAQLPPA